jgi:hypothetical protein
MLEQLGSFATAFLLYLMLGFPFLIWSGRTVYASVRTEIDGKVRGKPSTGATIFLAVIPVMLVAYYFLSGIGGVQHQQRVSDWGPYMFLSLPPACGLFAGYVIGAILGRKAAAE